ncbi:phage tail protein [Crossiella cryophila]|uniref:Phage tail-like protein n=1 Tax=Crossiella cryophila TaxID=43355 RepID=A0A7W7FT90_9PSEU|nr:phage tail protein [Crossiella cryophila]MBB4677901.1 phage tail-like protein [Crossiella cryophila]
MPQANPKTTRVDPYKNFRFRVKFGDGDYIAGISKVTGFTRTTEVVKHRSGGDPSLSYKLPGRTDYEAITLERGVTLDPEFEKWANKVWSFRNAAGGVETSLKDFRRDLLIDVFDDGGRKVLSYELHKAWVSEYKPLSDLDGNANAVLIQSIKLEHEGWVRDDSVVVPADNSFDDPTG